MSRFAEQVIRSAAEGFARVPPDFTALKIKDSIPDRADWDEFNSLLCEKLRQSGCTTMEDQLDRFWEENRTFRELSAYVDEDCGLI